MVLKFNTKYIKSLISENTFDQIKFDEKFKDLVRCTEDLYNSNAKLKLHNFKNKRKVNFNQRKALVQTLEKMNRYINEDGSIINRKDIRQNERFNQLEETLSQISLSVQAMNQQGLNNKMLNGAPFQP